MNCPCENCVCLPVCRHKEYYNLFKNCSLIKEYIPDYNIIYKRNKEYVYKLDEIMNPTRWSLKNGMNF